MNNKGITLAELLGVLVILSLIATITYPIVTKTIKEIRESVDKSQEQLIIDATKMWVNDYNYLLSNEEGSIYTLYIKDLGTNYLNKDEIKDLKNNKSLENACIKIKTEENKYTYKFLKECE